MRALNVSIKPDLNRPLSVSYTHLEAEQFGVEAIQQEHLPISYMVVSEAGASVYSASKLASEELGQYDVNLRSAVSIARRMQDPLAELVKIDPKSIGVGQYQHDMPAARLDAALGLSLIHIYHSAAAVGQILLCQIIVFVTGQAGVTDISHLGVVLEVFRHRLAVFTVALHADVEGFQPPVEQEGVLGRLDGTCLLYTSPVPCTGWSGCQSGIPWRVPERRGRGKR